MSTPPSELPTLRNVLEGALGCRLPIPFTQTGKNADKLLANLLALPNAYLERKINQVAGDGKRDEQLDDAIIKAIVKHLPKATASEVELVASGMVHEYLARRSGRLKTAQHIAQELSDDPPKEEAKEPISEDFLAFYNGTIDTIGTDDARILFAKIAAGEIKKPGSYSKLTLSILSRMDKETGQLFGILCNLSAVAPGGLDVRVITHNMGSAGDNCLLPFGLSFDALNILNHAGLIIADYNSWMPYGLATIGLPLAIGDRVFSLQANRPFADQQSAVDAVKRISGVAFTPSARELRTIVAMKLDEAYLARLIEAFRSTGFDLIERPRQ